MTPPHGCTSNAARHSRHGALQAFNKHPYGKAMFVGRLAGQRKDPLLPCPAATSIGMSEQPDPHVHGRREFLRGTALGLGMLATSWSQIVAAAEAASTARAAGEGFRHLGAADAADLGAIAARIVPTDDTPGATEAGVIWFIDQALGTFLAPETNELL